MRIYVNVNAAFDGIGTQDRPFRSINEAAKIAKPGDEVLVAPGVYREYVNPVNAGEEDARITLTLPSSCDEEESVQAVLAGMLLTLCSLRDDYPDYIEVLEV